MDFDGSAVNCLLLHVDVAFLVVIVIPSCGRDTYPTLETQQMQSDDKHRQMTAAAELAIEMSNLSLSEATWLPASFSNSDFVTVSSSSSAVWAKVQESPFWQ